MEETGPGVAKRQRLDAHSAINTTRRMHQQQQPDSPVSLPLHGHHHHHHNHHQGAAALNPPNAYRQTLPNSPYPHGAGGPGVEGRPVPEQPPHGGFTHPPLSSQYSSSRDSRPLSEQSAASYSRNGSISAPLRSPEEGHSLRPLTTSFEGEPQQHYSQPPNTEIVEPAPSYTPHEAPPHSSFHGLPMGQPPHDPGHPPPHAAAVPSYGESEMGHGHQAPTSYPPSGYSAVTPTSASWRPSYPPSMGIQPTKRSTRAQQACDTCRTRKAKCDEGKPQCSYCKETGQPCVYKEVQPAKADRAQKEIMDQLLRHKEDLLRNHNEMRLVSQQMESFNTSINQMYQMISSVLMNPGARGERPVSRATEVDNHVPKAEDYSVDRSPRGPTTPKAQEIGHMSEDPNAYEYARDSSVPGTDIARSIAVDHSTGVHRLLRWPFIKGLLESIAVRNYVKRPLNEDFVWQLEVSKGVLRLYGRGQGPDRYDGASSTNPASPATSTTSTTKSEDREQARSPAISLPDVWGANIGPPNMIDGKFSNNSYDDHPGGLNPDGTLKIDRTTIDMLTKSYLDNIHILHPFLDKTRLRRMVDKFWSQSHASEHKDQRSPFIHNSITHTDPTRKRKRQGSSGDSPRESSYSESSRREQDHGVERRVSTAIVLLVLALGKICAHKDFLPGPVPDISKEQVSTQYTSSPYGFDSPSIKNSFSRLSSPTSAAMSDGRSTSYGPRVHEYNASELNKRNGDRNVDVIPGLAYYTKATEILGALQGCIDLSTVQAHLLASLYMGQLACSIESWSWIGLASRNCLFLMRGTKVAEHKDEVRKQLIYFAYWTCFQFEGDILAELDLKSSGLEDYTFTPYPRSVQSVEDSMTGNPSTRPDEDRIIYYYSAQILMRSTLNKVQSTLYPPNSQVVSTSRASLIESRDACMTSLMAWRRILPNGLRWSDSDPPAGNILDARLRAKYWGTLYIITRPLLNYAIHHGQNHPNVSSGDHRAPYYSILEDNEVMKTCKECVFAARQSTEAFDAIVFVDGEPKNRLIVTNIFGTAHAQFGNMLVLAAIYRSPLQHLIDRSELVRLLNRTIKFLSKLAPISETLKTDSNILRGVLQSIEPSPAYPPPTTSFSST